MSLKNSIFCLLKYVYFGSWISSSYEQISIEFELQPLKIKELNYLGRISWLIFKYFANHCRFLWNWKWLFKLDCFLKVATDGRDILEEVDEMGGQGGSTSQSYPSLLPINSASQVQISLSLKNNSLEKKNIACSYYYFLFYFLNSCVLKLTIFF